LIEDCCLPTLAFLLSEFGPPTHFPRKSSKTRTASPATPTRPSPPRVRTAATESLFVDQTKFKHSIHGRMFACVDCHKDVGSLVHEKPPEKVSCAQCHADAQNGLRAFDPRQTQARPERILQPRAKTATATRTRSKRRRSQVARDHANIPATWAAATGSRSSWSRNGGKRPGFHLLQASVHGRAVANGSKDAAVCTDCHGTHEILPANDPKSPISKFSVASTCGTCHTDVANTFNVSIHGQALGTAMRWPPTCTDCHGIHSIKPHTDPNSPVAEQNVSRDICARCHEGVRLSQEFGVPGNRVTTYLDSYHGLAAEGGSVVAANCSVATVCTTFSPRAIRDLARARRRIAWSKWIRSRRPDRSPKEGSASDPPSS